MRFLIEYLGAFVFPDMFSLASAHHAFTDQEQLKDPQLLQRFQNIINAFIETSHLMQQSQEKLRV
jgi:chromate reductase, NAD(P)H dehydrogenase (quinone)